MRRGEKRDGQFGRLDKVSLQRIVEVFFKGIRTFVLRRRVTIRREESMIFESAKMAPSLRFSMKRLLLLTVAAAGLAYFVSFGRTPLKKETYATSTSDGKMVLMQYGASRRRFGGEEYLQYLIVSTSSEPWQQVSSTSLGDVEARLADAGASPSIAETCPIYEVVDGVPRMVCLRKITLDEFRKRMTSQGILTLEDVCGMGEPLGPFER